MVAHDTIMAGRETYLVARARPHHHHFNIEGLVNEAISRIAPFSGLILTVVVVIIFLIKHYFIEKFLMRSKLYKPHFDRLDSIQQCSFVNHHVAAACKIVLLFSAAYPFIAVAFGHATLQSPMIPHHRATNGDVMIVCSQIFTAMYIFELFFRKTISTISAAHHIGAIVITQAAVAISLNFNHEQDASIEFVLCFFWGAFDVVAELWPHIAMIIYRLYPGRHSLMYRIFLSITYLELAGTTFETVIIFWVWGALWNRWTLPFRIVTPILHALFSAAQLFGAWVFWKLAKKEKAKMMAQKAAELTPQPSEEWAGNSEDRAEWASSREKILVDGRRHEC